MSNQFLTIKDIVALDRLAGPDSVGLVDNIVNVVPELDRILGRPISGISYEATILTAIGSNGGFRKINSGRPFSAMSIDEKRFNCFPWDAPFSVDEALLIKKAGSGEAPAEVLDTFATSGARQKALDMSSQFYLGSLADPLGPPGLMDFLVTQRTQVDSRTGLKIDQVVDAGGSAAGSCETIWFIKQGFEGVHWLFGNGRGIIMNPWVRLPGMPSQDSTANNPLYSTQWRSNMFGYIGTSMAQYHSVGAIINVDVTNGTTTANGLWDDSLVADLFAKWPISMKPDLALCTQKAAAVLQKARTVTNFVSGKGRDWTTGSAPIADFPTSLPTMGNIPLVVTDGIKPGNKVVL